LGQQNQASLEGDPIAMKAYRKKIGNKYFIFDKNIKKDRPYSLTDENKNILYKRWLNTLGGIEVAAQFYEGAPPSTFDEIFDRMDEVNAGQRSRVSTFDSGTLFAHRQGKQKGQHFPAMVAEGETIIPTHKDGFMKDLQKLLESSPKENMTEKLEIKFDTMIAKFEELLKVNQEGNKIIANKEFKVENKNSEQKPSPLQARVQ
jgi:hypothetical protein